MKNLTMIGQAVLYLFIISSGLQVGAAVFEILVITPLWAGALPESVTNWNPVAHYAINQGLFWAKATPFYAVCGLLMIIFAWLMPKAQRNLSLFAGILALLTVIATLNFFVPILMKTIVTRGAGYSGAEITQMVNSWVNWNWLRLAAVLAAWLAAIHALADRQIK